MTFRVTIGNLNLPKTYADDTTLLASGANHAESAEMLNRDLCKISQWAETWKVSFGAEKSHDLLFSLNDQVNSNPVKYRGDTIKKVTVHKHLGVNLTGNLDWSIQIYNVCLRANRKLSVLRRVQYLQRSTLDMLYKVSVRSIIYYALPI